MYVHMSNIFMNSTEWQNYRSPLFLVVKPPALLFHMHLSIPSLLGFVSCQVPCPYCLSPHSSYHGITNSLTNHHQLPSAAVQHIYFHAVLPSEAHPEQMFPSHFSLAKVLFVSNFFFPPI